jgi:hypothetical protein
MLMHRPTSGKAPTETIEPGVQTGGVKMIPVQTPAGTFKV